MPINAINMLNTRPSAENTGFKGRKIQSEQTKVSKEPMVKIPLATLKTLLLASTIATAPMVTSCNSDEPLDDIIENPTTTTTNPKDTTVTKTPIEENNEKSPVQTTLKSILSTLGIIPTNTTRTYNATSGDLTNINYVRRDTTDLGIINVTNEYSLNKDESTDSKQIYDGTTTMDTRNGLGNPVFDRKVIEKVDDKTIRVSEYMKLTNGNLQAYERLLMTDKGDSVNVKYVDEKDEAYSEASLKKVGNNKLLLDDSGIWANQYLDVNSVKFAE